MASSDMNPPWSPLTDVESSDKIPNSSLPAGDLKIRDSNPSYLAATIPETIELHNLGPIVEAPKPSDLAASGATDETVEHWDSELMFGEPDSCDLAISGTTSETVEPRKLELLLSDPDETAQTQTQKAKKRTSTSKYMFIFSINDMQMVRDYLNLPKSESPEAPATYDVVVQMSYEWESRPFDMTLFVKKQTDGKLVSYELKRIQVWPPTYLGKRLFKIRDEEGVDLLSKIERPKVRKQVEKAVDSYMTEEHIRKEKEKKKEKTEKTEYKEEFVLSWGVSMKLSSGMAA